MKDKIIPFFAATCIALATSGCAQSTWLYRVSIQQGNVITRDLVRQIHPGMSKEAVADLLGPPLLADTFNDNRWTYIYTYKGPRGKVKFIERELIIYFKNNRIYAFNSKNIPDTPAPLDHEIPKV